MFEQEYVDGFVEKCAELGRDPSDFGFEKKSELQLLTVALPSMQSTDLDYPLIAIDQVVPVGDKIAERTASTAIIRIATEWNTTIHTS